MGAPPENDRKSQITKIKKTCKKKQKKSTNEKEQILKTNWKYQIFGTKQLTIQIISKLSKDLTYYFRWTSTLTWFALDRKAGFQIMRFCLMSPVHFPKVTSYYDKQRILSQILGYGLATWCDTKLTK